jgi:hypothetical protein
MFHFPILYNLALCIYMSYETSTDALHVITHNVQCFYVLDTLQFGMGCPERR